MQTDYDNLNSFDCALVFAIVAGIAILGAIVFVGLPSSARANVVAALSILDISDESRDFTSDAALVLDFSKDYMDQFYLAFNEVAVIPADYINNFTDYTEAVARIYQSNNVAMSEGRVAGEYWDLAPIATPEPEQLTMPYTYIQPEIKTKINFNY